MTVTVTARAVTLAHVDTCLACYVLDHHNRPGECLIGVPVDGRTRMHELKTALRDEMRAVLPEGAPDDASVAAAVAECFADAHPFAKFDRSLDIIGDDCTAENVQAWFVLRWPVADETPDAPAPVSAEPTMSTPPAPAMVPQPVQQQQARAGDPRIMTGEAEITARAIEQLRQRFFASHDLVSDIATSVYRDQFEANGFSTGEGEVYTAPYTRGVLTAYPVVIRGSYYTADTARPGEEPRQWGVFEPSPVGLQWYGSRDEAKQALWRRYGDKIILETPPMPAHRPAPDHGLSPASPGDRVATMLQSNLNAALRGAEAQSLFEGEFGEMYSRWLKSAEVCLDRIDGGAVCYTGANPAGAGYAFNGIAPGFYDYDVFSIHVVAETYAYGTRYRFGFCEELENEKTWLQFETFADAAEAAWWLNGARWFAGIKQLIADGVMNADGTPGPNSRDAVPHDPADNDAEVIAWGEAAEAAWGAARFIHLPDTAAPSIDHDDMPAELVALIDEMRPVMGELVAEYGPYVSPRVTYGL